MIDVVKNGKNFLYKIETWEVGT